MTDKLSLGDRRASGLFRPALSSGGAFETRIEFVAYLADDWLCCLGKQSCKILKTIRDERLLTADEPSAWALIDDLQP